MLDDEKLVGDQFWEAFWELCGERQHIYAKHLHPRRYILYLFLPAALGVIG